MLDIPWFSNYCSIFHVDIQCAPQPFYKTMFAVDYRLKCPRGKVNVYAGVQNKAT